MATGAPESGHLLGSPALTQSLATPKTPACTTQFLHVTSPHLVGLLWGACPDPPAHPVNPDLPSQRPSLVVSPSPHLAHSGSVRVMECRSSSHIRANQKEEKRTRVVSQRVTKGLSNQARSRGSSPPNSVRWAWYSRTNNQSK